MNTALLGAARRRADDRLLVLPTAGLLALYDFVQGVDPQVLYDRSGSGNNGTLGATAAAESTDPAWTNEGLLLDGVNDLVSINIPLAGNKSLVFALTPASSSGTQIYMRAVEAPIYVGQTVNAGASRLIVSDIYGGTQRTLYSEAYSPVAIGQAMFIATTHNDGIQGLYKNNDFFFTAFTGSPKSSGLTHIGAYGSTGTLPFAGTIHAVLVYNRVLSSGEVSTIQRTLRRSLRQRGVSLP